MAESDLPDGAELAEAVDKFLKEQQSPIIDPDQPTDELTIATTLLRNSVREALRSQGKNLEDELSRPMYDIAVEMTYDENALGKLPLALIQFVNAQYPNRSVGIQKITIRYDKSSSLPPMAFMGFHASPNPIVSDETIEIAVIPLEYISEVEQERWKDDYWVVRKIVLPDKNVARMPLLNLHLPSDDSNLEEGVFVVEQELRDWLRDPRSYPKGILIDEIDPSVISAIGGIIVDESLGKRTVTVN